MGGRHRQHTICQLPRLVGADDRQSQYRARETDATSETNYVTQETVEDACSLRDIVLGATPDALGPIEEELSIAESRLGVLIDRNNDRLNVLVSPAFSRSQMANLRKRLDPKWIVGV